MPLLASDYQSSQGQNPPGTLSNFNPGEFGRTFVVPHQPQEDTIEVTTGDATAGWSLTVTNNTTGDAETFVFQPVDSAGVASAVAADAAITLIATWNALPTLLEFGRATLESTATVRIVYNNDLHTFTVVLTPAGIGADTTVSPAVTASSVGIEVGTFAFRPLDAAITAGADPLSLVTPTGAIIEQFVGGLARNDSTTGQGFDSALTFPTYRRGDNAPVAQRAVMAMRAVVAVTVVSVPAAVVSAGAGERDGQLTTGAGLSLAGTGTTIYRGAPAGGIALVQFTIA